MKKKIKSYLVFTSFWYRICVFFLMPAALAGIGACAGSRFGQFGVLGAAMLLTIGEVLSDYWLFPGLMAKESEGLTVLRTSGMGMELLRHALVLDLLRKLLTALVVLAVCSLFTGRFEGLLPMVLVSYTCSASGTCLARHVDGIALNAWIGQFAAAMVFLFYGFRSGLPRFYTGCDLLFLVLGILVSALTVKKAMEKIKGGYYDQ